MNSNARCNARANEGNVPSIGIQIPNSFCFECGKGENEKESKAAHV